MQDYLQHFGPMLWHIPSIALIALRVIIWWRDLALAASHRERSRWDKLFPARNGFGSQLITVALIGLSSAHA
jgi:hypothetical protein